jgi:hypothetical protein
MKNILNLKLEHKDTQTNTQRTICIIRHDAYFLSHHNKGNQQITHYNYGQNIERHKIQRNPQLEAVPIYGGPATGRKTPGQEKEKSNMFEVNHRTNANGKFVLDKVAMQKTVCTNHMTMSQLDVVTI